MNRQISLLDKHQPHPFSVQSWLLEYLNVWQERQSRNGLSITTLKPGGIRQFADMASFSYAAARHCLVSAIMFLVEPKEISTASVRDLCLFIRVTGLLNLC
jgi:hypothetical protein